MALDTNALIDHLSRIQALYMVLQAYVGHHVSLLIPTAVVNGAFLPPAAVNRLI
jgi:hypothetical protein